MQIQVLKSKIAKVTGAGFKLYGSITIDELLEASNIIEGEKVSIVNINNGERFNLCHQRRKKIPEQ
jgi:aspartate 1-decarboxylase